MPLTNMWTDPVAVRVALDHLGSLAVPDGPLGSRTTYRVGGPAAVLATVEGVTDLQKVAAAAMASGLPTLPVGRGSNLLVADRGFEGIAVVLGEGMAEITICDKGTVVAGGSTSLPVLARRTVAAGLTGMEWAVGVPGSVGGAVRMNAGGHGSDTSRLVRSARLVSLETGKITTLGAGEFGFGYRSSMLSDSDVIVSATFQLQAADDREPERGAAELTDIVRWRRENQPGGQNAGSVFVNPAGESAGALVESLGLKGHRIGSAEVSGKHANFIQADEAGSADDVRALMIDVANRVRRELGIELHTEIRTIGFVNEGES
jgi:UDP-N-acetylmuramate dehydrogenase